MGSLRAYKAGRAAHDAGLSRNSNPYTSKPQQSWWLAGWDDAQTENEDDNGKK